jgi:non-specific serine/threonine protein kinase/serine/threonine-protein kinase
MSELHDRVSELFLAARRLNASQREAFLDDACAEDKFLRVEIESLLAHDHDHEEFLETPALGAGFDVGSASFAGDGCSLPRGEAAPPPVELPERIAGYRLLRRLGEGGMGVVYLAEQERPRRQVALKVLRTGMTSPNMLRRFEYEAHVLARLQHPGIAQIFEAGTAETIHGRQAFFAMEFVQGRLLTEYADAVRLTSLERLALFVRICDAVQHAHQKGVIHRDLKPANILVDEAGRPKILDFGVARAADTDMQMTVMHTDVGQLVGTLPYMSPEQVAGRPDDLDTRSDVYALGVILYELLARRLPHDLKGRTLHEAARLIREREPPPLGTIDRAFRGDVATIVAKALEKDRERRYASASDLAADIQRCLSDEPIVARPASQFYRMRKFARRNRALVGGVAATFVTLIIGVIVASGLALREAEQRRLAVEASRDAERSAELARDNERKARVVADYFSEVFHGVTPYATGAEVRLRDVIDHAVAELGRRFADQPLVEASLRNEFGSIYHELVMLDQAAAQYEQGLAVCPREPQAAAIERLKLLNNLGLLRTHQGRPAEAETLLSQALAGRREALGEDAADTLATLNNLAMAVQNLGRAEEAEAMFRDALSRQQEVLGEQHDTTLTTMANIANILRDRDALGEAETLDRRVAAGMEQVHGPDHPRTLMALGNLGQTLRKQRRYDEVEPLYRRQVAGLKAALGDDHPSTLTALANLASLRKAQGEPAESLALYRESYEGCLRRLGPDHPTTLAVANAYARTLRENGRFAEAEPILRGVLDGRRRTLGEGHEDTLDAMHRLVQTLRQRATPEDAASLEQAALLCADLVAAARASLAADDWRIARYRGEYGRCLAELGRVQEAETELRAAHADFERILGPDHRRTRDALAALSALGPSPTSSP